MAYAACAANAVVVDRAAFAFPRADLFRYSAKWWSYLVPPVGHSLLGATAQRVWDAVDVREGVLVALAAGEYAVSPSALWRDVLPAAQRWVTRQPGRVRALDCVPLNQESESVQWLTGQRVTLLRSSTSDCTEPNLSRKLAATGYTHLLVRRDTTDGQWFAAHPAPDGLRVAARFDDGQVFAVTAHTPAIYTATMMGFYPREHNAEWSWRWMGADAAWTIVNTGARPIVAAVGIEMSAFHRARHMELPSFDAIYSMGTIEHFDETERAVEEMARVLNPVRVPGSPRSGRAEARLPAGDRRHQT